MKLRIDNIDGFNRLFNTDYVLSRNQERFYFIDVEELEGVRDEKHFWEIVNSSSGARACSVEEIK